MTNNTFPILRLPSLAFQNVFEQLDSFQILMFSLCSNATKKLLKLFKTEKPLLFRLTLTKEGGAEIFFHYCQFTKNRETMKRDYANILSSWTQLIPYNDNISIERRSGQVPDEWADIADNESKFALFKIIWKKTDEELKKWIKNIAEIFGTAIGYVDVYHNNEDMFNWFPKEPTIKIEKFTFHVEVSPELSMRFQDGILDLPRSSFFKLHHLISASKKFHRIDLTNSLLSDKDLNMFIKEWISGSSDLDKLEYLTITRPRSGLKMLERKVINGIPVERNEDYEDRVFIPPSTPYDEFSFEDGLDLQRRDGKKATILIEKNRMRRGNWSFKFLVWK